MNGVYVYIFNPTLSLLLKVQLLHAHSTHTPLNSPANQTHATLPRLHAPPLPLSKGRIKNRNE